METWSLIFFSTISLCIFTIVFKSITSKIVSLNNDKPTLKRLPLPPGPSTLKVIKSFLIHIWHRSTVFDMESKLRQVKLRYGPLFSLGLKSKPTIFIAGHSLAHLALIQKGSVFSSRPTAHNATFSKIFDSNAHKISTAAYGATWRLLRRNLFSEMLHPSRVKLYSRARRWVLSLLIRQLIGQNPQPIQVFEHFRYAMFSLLVFMCFGDKLPEEKIREIEGLQRRWLLSLGRLNMFIIWPKLGKILFGKQWEELFQVRNEQVNTFLPLIRARIDRKEQSKSDAVDEPVAYVDTLLDLQLPDESRKLNDQELVSLTGEFLNTGADTTATALQWIMANLVKYPAIQDKLFEEIVEVVGQPKALSISVENDEEDNHSEDDLLEGLCVKEEDIEKMPYLKAIVLEALRRHPPANFVLPHSVTEDVELEGYLIPKNATVNVMVSDLGWDPNVWEDPMEFRPERFLLERSSSANNDSALFDLTGNKEIKMMPFGVGRRMCPGYGLALLHLEYFVANLVWNFEWKGVDGVEVDLSEKQEFTVTMKNPLRAHISPRIQ
ncbi:OLC1v1025493C1 [Oldenlandia corymbosa var. corymbosa]|uniref:OLC1v1025493C1 n=1 Tax=Oldenlandia corymbosa var. corymbosa TaxID=529605 RepID=A0AAV1C5A9_OLDCO|nr:OLC1v1025493C1 [Oldenlandia corymbosa var. corymbosa]